VPEVCPRCREDVILPSLGDLRSTVVCSHCDAEFTIADFSIHTVPSFDFEPPPAALPIREPDPSVPASVAKPTTIPAQTMYPHNNPSDADIQALRADVGADFSASEGATNPSVFELVPVGEEGYDDRTIIPYRPGFGFGSLVRCVIGLGWAFVALQALCWWGLRYDPAGLAPHVPPEVAFILPPELRPAIPFDAPRPEVIASQPEAAPAEPQAFDASNDVSGDIESSYVTTASATSALSTSPTPSDGEREAVFDRAVFEKTPLQNDAEDLTISTTSNSPSGEAGAAGGSAVPDYVTGATPPPRLNPESIFIGNGPRWSKTFEQADLDAAIAATGKANRSFDDQQYSGISNRERMRNAKIFYAVFCNLGERATMVKISPDIAQSLADSRDVLRSIAGNEIKINMFANASRNWMQKRLGKGVATAAKVNAIREVGSLFELQIQMLDSKATLATVVTRTNPANNPWARFDVGDKILFMGVLVEDPEVRLPVQPVLPLICLAVSRSRTRLTSNKHTTAGTRATAAAG